MEMPETKVEQIWIHIFMQFPRKLIMICGNTKRINPSLFRVNREPVKPCQQNLSWSIWRISLARRYLGEAVQVIHRVLNLEFSHPTQSWNPSATRRPFEMTIHHVLENLFKLILLRTSQLLELKWRRTYLKNHVLCFRHVSDSLNSAIII